jgi:hypothetical protein
MAMGAMQDKERQEERNIYVSDQKNTKKIKRYKEKLLCQGGIDMAVGRRRVGLQHSCSYSDFAQWARGICQSLYIEVAKPEHPRIVKIKVENK